jgi:conjugal transfer pilus assembly protein TraV
MKITIIIALVSLASACSVLPYENDYSCRLEDNYGKCMSIQDSYDGGKGNDADLKLVPGERVDLNRKHKKKKGAKYGYVPQLTSEEMYINELYREMSLLIREPETPIIKAPKEMRTLILSYSGQKNKKTLYMPRYVYTIIEDAEFVIKQYFKTPERDAHIIEPKRVK